MSNQPAQDDVTIDDPEIRIDKAILHVVNHIDKELALTNQPLVLDEAAALFFGRHIRKIISHGQAARGRFDVDKPEGERMRLLCGQMINDVEFVPNTKEAASRLYDAMTTATISRGDVVMARYQDLKEMGRNGEPAPFQLAILKMDISNGYRREANTQAGITVIKLEKVNDVLPIRDIQKGALVRLDGKQEPLVDFLDLQISASRRRNYVASFWQNDFLVIQPKLDARRYTSLFLHHTKEFIKDKQKAGELDDKTSQQLLDALPQELQKKRIDPAAYAQESFDKPEWQEELPNKLREKGLTVPHFIPAEEEVWRAQVVRYIGEPLLDLQVGLADFEEIGAGSNAQPTKRVVFEEQGDGSVVIRIRASNLEKKDPRKPLNL